MNEGTTNFPKDSLKISLPVEQVDLNHEDSLIPTQPLDYIQDEIDLKPVSPLPGRTSVTRKNKDPLAPGPSITKKPSKRVQLNRRRPLADLSRAGSGPSYGLPDGDCSQSGDMDLKITSVLGGCPEVHDDIPNKQELKEEPAPEASKARDRLFTEIERDGPENIADNISSLSLSVSLDEVVVLRKIFEENRK